MNPGRTPRERILHDLNEAVNCLWIATQAGEPAFVAVARRALDRLEALTTEEAEP